MCYVFKNFICEELNKIFVRILMRNLDFIFREFMEEIQNGCLEIFVWCSWLKMRNLYLDLRQKMMDVLRYNRSQVEMIGQQ